MDASDGPWCRICQSDHSDVYESCATHSAVRGNAQSDKCSCKRRLSSWKWAVEHGHDSVTRSCAWNWTQQGQLLEYSCAKWNTLWPKDKGTTFSSPICCYHSYKRSCGTKRQDRIVRYCSHYALL